MGHDKHGIIVLGSSVLGYLNVVSSTILWNGYRDVNIFLWEAIENLWNISVLLHSRSCGRAILCEIHVGSSISLIPPTVPYFLDNKNSKT